MPISLGVTDATESGYQLVRPVQLQSNDIEIATE